MSPVIMSYFRSGRVSEKWTSVICGACLYMLDAVAVTQMSKYQQRQATEETLAVFVSEFVG